MQPPDLKCIAENEPDLAGVRFIRHLPGGPVGRSWLVDLNGRKAVLRCDGEFAHALALDRSIEIEVLRLASAGGFGPAMIWASPERGLLLTGWVEGRVWGPDDMVQPGQLRRLGYRVAELHDSAMVLPILDLEHAINAYAGLAGCSTASILRRDALAVLAALDLCPDDFTPTHNDLGCRNIVEFDENGIIFLDWEYGGLFDPLFDIAGIVHENSLSEAALRMLLDGYGGNTANRNGFWRRFGAFRQLYGAVATLWQLAVQAGRATEQLHRGS